VSGGAPIQGGHPLARVGYLVKTPPLKVTALPTGPLGGGEGAERVAKEAGRKTAKSQVEPVSA